MVGRGSLAGVLIAAVVVAGCFDDDAPRDLTPPAAPRGVYSVTGDQSVAVHWIANTEADLAGYHVYAADCLNGPECPYRRIGTTSRVDFLATNLANGRTYYLAVTAYDRHGNESELSREDVFDTPRPEGINASLRNFVDDPALAAGWDFSTATARRYDDPNTDIFFGDNGNVSEMFAADNLTDIQDAGWHSSLDGVDFAPSQGWSPTGSVELIVGHCYVVWTRDDHYAKLRVTSLTSSQVTFDWAYQVAAGNPELAARKPVEELRRRPIVWAR